MSFSILLAAACAPKSDDTASDEPSSAPSYSLELTDQDHDQIYLVESSDDSSGPTGWYPTAHTGDFYNAGETREYCMNDYGDLRLHLTARRNSEVKIYAGFEEPYEEFVYDGHDQFGASIDSEEGFAAEDLMTYGEGFFYPVDENYIQESDEDDGVDFYYTAYNEGDFVPYDGKIYFFATTNDDDVELSEGAVEDYETYRPGDLLDRGILVYYKATHPDYSDSDDCEW